MSQDLLSFLDEPEPERQSQLPSTLPEERPGQIEPWSSEFQSVYGQKPNNPIEPENPHQESSSTGRDIFLNVGRGDDEDFGDFEDASPAPTSAIAPVPSNVVSQPKPETPKPKPPAKEVRSPFPPKASKPPKLAPATKTPSPPKKEPTGSHPFAGRMDLLFEADGDDYDAGADELGDLANNPEAAMEYSKRIIAEQEETARTKGKGKSLEGQTGGFVDLEEAGEKRLRKAGGKDERAKDPNVLFDADDVSDDGGGGEDEDFGEFETWGEPVATTPAQSRKGAEPWSSGMDLLGLDDRPTQQTPKATQARSESRSAKVVQPNGAKKSPTTVKQQDDDFWDDFETTASAPKQRQPRTSRPQRDDTWDDFETSAPTLPPTKASPTCTPKPHPSTAPPSSQPLPPTNIPPPTTLLSLFPALFASADESLFTAMAKLDLKSRSMLLSHPASHQFLRGYLAHMTVLARIVAGRKSRWKRDQRLSQSMRIGPAAAGGKGGMKLAGLDKSEVAKEDREVLDTIRLYRAQIGKLRSAVTAASAAPGLPKLPAVPDIQDPMPVKALKQSEGGIAAREACALCGLKREERVVKVDEGVEDSFGEWWVQSMGMHVQCKGFWEEFERRLKSR